jgi:IclR family transcriptional regulator, acetate operon repressor
MASGPGPVATTTRAGSPVREPPAPGSPAVIQSVDRAVDVLEYLARHGDAAVTDLATALGVHRSTAFRLLAALEARGLVEQVSERGRYRLGFGIVRLAGASAARLDLVEQCRPVTQRLALELADTVNVARLEAGAAVNVDQVRGPAAVTSHNWMGQRTPLHATSSGKVLLAHLDPEARDRLLAEPLERFTPATITDPAMLRRELDAVIAAGWASTVEELELGLNAVAAPIRQHDGTVIAAVSVSGPSYRLAAGRIPEVAVTVVAAADEISGRLGLFRQDGGAAHDPHAAQRT